MSRVLVSDFTSGGGWNNPEIINQKTVENDDKETLKGFSFNPAVEFFFTEADTGEIVNSETVYNKNNDPSNYNLIRMLVLAYADTSGQNLNENSTPEEVQAAIQGEQVRVTGKKRDDLQAVMRLLKAADLEQSFQYTNFKD